MEGSCIILWKSFDNVCCQNTAVPKTYTAISAFVESVLIGIVQTYRKLIFVKPLNMKAPTRGFHNKSKEEPFFVPPNNYLKENVSAIKNLFSN